MPGKKEIKEWWEHTGTDKILPNISRINTNPSQTLARNWKGRNISKVIFSGKHNLDIKTGQITEINQISQMKDKNHVIILIGAE